MKKYNLLVIDDNLADRKNAYLCVLSAKSFKVTFAESKDDLMSILLGGEIFDAYIVDAFLDIGDWKEYGTADRLLEEINKVAPKHIPAFLISRKWGDPRAMEILTKISKNSSIELLRFLAFQDFEKSLEMSNAMMKRNEGFSEGTEKNDEFGGLKESIEYKIIDDLVVWHELTDLRVKDNGSIRVLLLADLQYGDKNTSNTSTFTEEWILRALNKDNLLPHLIVIAGDIAYSGEPSQYSLAKNKLSKIVSQMESVTHCNNYGERVIIVPGNHDANLNFLACDKTFWSPKEKKWMDRELPTIHDSDDKEMYTTNLGYGLEPFRQFAKALTKSKVWDSKGSKCRIDQRFEQYGLRFYLFNTTSKITVDEPKIAEFDESSLSRINSELGISANPDKMFNIAISHHGVKTGATKEVQISNWDSVGIQYFHTHDIKLWLFGHYHKHNSYKLTEAPFDERYLSIVEAATLRITPREAHPRGFSLLEFKRENGVVEEVLDFFYAVQPDGTILDHQPPKSIYKK